MCISQRFLRFELILHKFDFLLLCNECVNYVCMYGHGTVREGVVGKVDPKYFNHGNLEKLFFMLLIFFSYYR